MAVEQLKQTTEFDEFYNVEVAGAIGKIVFASRPMSTEQAQGFWDRGIPVPLEIMPSSFWHLPDGTNRFGEEQLGKDF